MSGMPEPTLADVLTRLDGLGSEIKDLRAEIRILGLENRAGIAELKNDVQTVRADVRIMFDFLADFRREYTEHDHPDTT